MSALLKLVSNEKTCTKCQVVKPLTDFYQRKKDGYFTSSCKVCWKTSCKSWREKDKIKNPDRPKQKYKNYRSKINFSPEKYREHLDKKNKWNHSDKYYDMYYKKRFGISFSEVKSMLAIQNGCCANIGCGCEIAIHPKDEQKKACVDHCHTTGKVRAMLCVKCNTLLGHVENTKTVVFGLLDYLNKHNKVGE